MGAAFARAAKVLRRSGRDVVAGDEFDQTYKTETSIVVPLWRLRIPSRNAKFGARYQTMNPAEFLAVLRKVREDAQGLVFIDLGCGKGRTLILAAKEGFRRVIGVEFSPELAAVARENARRADASVEIVEMDACLYIPPDDDLLIYMYNPFGGQVVDSVLRNLRNWAAQYSKKAFVIYVNPVCRARFDSVPEFGIVVDQEGLCIWRLQN